MQSCVSTTRPALLAAAAGAMVHRLRVCMRAGPLRAEGEQSLHTHDTELARGASVALSYRRLGCSTRDQGCVAAASAGDSEVGSRVAGGDWSCCTSARMTAQLDHGLNAAMA
jgi:hypothetical protein